MKRGFGAAALAMMVPAMAQAASNEGVFAVKEAGRQTCETYIAERAEQSQAYVLFLGWIAGYISAHNKLSEETLDITPWQSTRLLASMLNKYCETHGEVLFVRAVGAMLEAFEPTRLRGNPEMVEAKSGDTVIPIYREILRRAQQGLTELGHYRGEHDGLYSPETVEALVAYQREKGIKETGLPDQSTLIRLFK